jgi:type IV pilus assembly protein PilC
MQLSQERARIRGTAMSTAIFAEHRVGWKSLSLWCRSLGTMLRSGVHLVKALKISGGQTADPSLQSAMKSVVDDLTNGEDIATALKNRDPYFPDLVTDMVQVAEQTGALPEVLAGLADHYENLLRLRKMFLSQIAWPLIQLGIAICVIAGLILILGLIADARGGKPIDVLGLGLFGVTGALIWLAYCIGTAAFVWIIYMFLVRGLRQKARIDGFLLRIPIIGDCMRSFAVARFSWAFALTQQSGMDVKTSLESSLKATSNGAFINAIPFVTVHVMEGEELTDALAQTQLFPPDVLEMIRVGEESGMVPETLQELGPQFEERARRSLTALTVAFAWLVWLFVAVLITFFVFRIALFYIGMITDAANGNFDAFDR